MTKLEALRNAVHMYEAIPRDNHKSFYGKAIVAEYADGGKALISYDTVVMVQKPNGEYINTWGGWSATTGRHIAAFSGMNKAAYDKLPYVEI